MLAQNGFLGELLDDGLCAAPMSVAINHTPCVLRTIKPHDELSQSVEADCRQKQVMGHAKIHPKDWTNNARHKQANPNCPDKAIQHARIRHDCSPLYIVQQFSQLGF
mgnify:CR=1 FL=1